MKRVKRIVVALGVAATISIGITLAAATPASASTSWFVQSYDSVGACQAAAAWYQFEARWVYHLQSTYWCSGTWLVVSSP